MSARKRSVSFRIVVVALCFAGALTGCRAVVSAVEAPDPNGPNGPNGPNEDADVRAVRAVLVRLYDAFGFEPGGEPDWATQRRLALPGAAFVPSLRPDRRPVATGIEPFLDDFHGFATSEPWSETGLFERIVGLRIERFGALAHAFVAFEGHLPGEEAAVTRGLDSVQLVHDGEGWRVTAFATQFEREGLVLPERFVSVR